MEHTESQRNSNAKLTLILDTIVPKLTSTITDLIVILEKFGNSLIIVSILQYNHHNTFLTPSSALPSFAASEEERATTRHLALTTITTFFSSITATTLQFSYQQTSGRLSSFVNLFWFLSLVFSVTSGVSSLLALIWRRSFMYVTLAVNIPTLRFCAATLTSGLQITSDFGSVGCPSSSWPFQHLLLWSD